MRAAITGFALILCCGLAACGGATTSLDVCHANCESAGRCVPEPRSQIQMCHDSCGQRAAEFIQTDKAQNGACKNAEDLRAKSVSCYNGDCGAVDACIQQVQSSCVVING